MSTLWYMHHSHRYASRHIAHEIVAQRVLGHPFQRRNHVAQKREHPELAHYVAQLVAHCC